MAKADLSVTADNKSKVYGEANPPLTISYLGFKFYDSALDITPPVASTTATDASGFGSYPITLSGGSADNY